MPSTAFPHRKNLGRFFTLNLCFFNGRARIELYNMDVSENSGFSPQIIHFHRGFPLFSPSILGFSPSFWKHPYQLFFFKSSKPFSESKLWNSITQSFSSSQKCRESDSDAPTHLINGRLSIKGGVGLSVSSSNITVFRIPTISKEPKKGSLGRIEMEEMQV